MIGKPRVSEHNTIQIDPQIAPKRNATNRMRGRIHANNDVINGISGLEQLSNALHTRP